MARGFQKEIRSPLTEAGRKSSLPPFFLQGQWLNTKRHCPSPPRIIAPGPLTFLREHKGEEYAECHL